MHLGSESLPSVAIDVLDFNAVHLGRYGYTIACMHAVLPSYIYLHDACPSMGLFVVSADVRGLVWCGVALRCVASRRGAWRTHSICLYRQGAVGPS